MGQGLLEATNKINDGDEPLLRILRSLILTVVALACHDVINIKSALSAVGISWRQNNSKNTRPDRFVRRMGFVVLQYSTIACKRLGFIEQTGCSGEGNE